MSYKRTEYRYTLCGYVVEITFWDPFSAWGISGRYLTGPRENLGETWDDRKIYANGTLTYPCSYDLDEKDFFLTDKKVSPDEMPELFL